VKGGLESSPGITGTQVAVCKIDTSKMSAAVGNNEYPGNTRYNNFSFDEDNMQVWQAYGVGKGMKIKHFDSKQDVSGLERAHQWSQEVKRKQQKRSKTKSKTCNSDLVNRYASLEPSYILTFSTRDDADEHMDTGCHVMLPENECNFCQGKESED